MTMYCVYVARDVDEKVLYVGLTGNFSRRQSEHAKNSGWFSLCANFEIIHCKDAESCRNMELRMIKELLPKFNLADTGPENRERISLSLRKTHARRRFVGALFACHIKASISKNPSIAENYTVMGAMRIIKSQGKKNATLSKIIKQSSDLSGIDMPYDYDFYRKIYNG
jgi:predicted GIY-YIG superfamily endonuclease